MKLLFIPVVFLSSCMSPRVYVPAMPATPLFEKKKDGYLDVSGNIFGMVNGTLGVAITNRIGAYAGIGAHFGDNYMWPLRPDYRMTSRTINQTLGIGLYRNVAHSANRRLECFAEFNRGVFEVFGSSYNYSRATRVGHYALIDGKYNQFSLLLNRSFKSYRRQFCFSFKVGGAHFF